MYSKIKFNEIAFESLARSLTLSMTYDNFYDLTGSIFDFIKNVDFQKKKKKKLQMKQKK